MELRTTTKLRIGEWCVDPNSGEISRNGEIARVEVRTMRLLLCLAEQAGEVVSIDDLLNQVWPGISVSQDSVYQAVASLRRLLGDDPKQPIYIATVPRLGYRMVATVGPWAMPNALTADKEAAPSEILTSGDLGPATPMPTATVDAPSFGRRRRPGFTGLGFKGAGWVAAAAICLTLIGAYLLHNRLASPAAITSSQPENSIAVLPFLDLTEGMKEEEFADGMTEELIDKISKIPGVRVPSATSSFYFKSKQMSVADLAKALNVAYVVDGSVRKSGSRLRVAARLVHADNGYVIWSETYDRPFNDILMVQDNIASEVTKALKASIESKPNH